MKCKFCGCTEEHGCGIPIDFLPPEQQAVYPSSHFACAWLWPNVCSSPSCVEKAYLEARPLAESIDEALRMEEAA